MPRIPLNSAEALLTVPELNRVIGVLRCSYDVDIRSDHEGYWTVHFTYEAASDAGDNSNQRCSSCRISAINAGACGCIPPYGRFRLMAHRWKGHITRT